MRAYDREKKNEENSQRYCEYTIAYGIFKQQGFKWDDEQHGLMPVSVSQRQTGELQLH